EPTGFARVLYNKWYVDEFYHRWVVDPVLTTSRILWRVVDATIIDGTVKGAAAALAGEYPRLYKRMGDLVRQGQCDVDVRPMTLVADIFTLGRRERVAPFVESATDAA
ncbi:MAG: hypothetical protein ABGY42_17565, partial [bacterium]